MVKFNNIFLIGPMGAGKTTIGTHLSKSLKMDFFDSDQVIEDRTGVDINWIFDVEGEEGFRQREILIIDELTQMRGIVLATGGGVVVEPENRKNLAARGFVIYLKASLEQQLQRIEYDRRRPLLQTDDKRSTLVKLGDERESFYEEIADVVFSTDARNVRSVANDVLNFLLEHQNV